MNEKTHPKQLRTPLHVFPSLCPHRCLLLCPSLNLLFPPIPSLGFCPSLESFLLLFFGWRGRSSGHHVLSVSPVSGTDGAICFRNPSGIFQKVSIAWSGVFQMWRLRPRERKRGALVTPEPQPLATPPPKAVSFRLSTSNSILPPAWYIIACPAASLTPPRYKDVSIKHLPQGLQTQMHPGARHGTQMSSAGQGGTEAAFPG